jgi:Meiotically up-regulated gene 113
LYAIGVGGRRISAECSPQIQPTAKEKMATTRQHILEEIKRTTKENGGAPLGKERFFQETGIKYGDWFGKYWVRWGDALKEAGFAPNKLQDAYDEDVLIEKYIALVRELGHIPVRGELLMKRRRDPSFPDSKTYERLGSKAQLISKLLEYCSNHEGFEDVAQLCAALPSSEQTAVRENAKPDGDGCVYMLKVGRYYKIGKTNAIGRREYELAIQLPQKARTVHVIRADDPGGIETYWHTRFAAKRTNGEWFELDNADVQAFKRRQKFM